MTDISIGLDCRIRDRRVAQIREQNEAEIRNENKHCKLY